MVSLIVNGIRHDVENRDDVPLIYVLRNDLGLKSVKLGCALEQCGACKVLVDGKPVNSCVASAATFSGRRIETVEGFARGDSLIAVQQVLLDANAAQCGYCLSGILIAAKALFETTPKPSPHADPHGAR